MSRMDALIEDPVISRLKGLIGGNFVAGKVSVDSISDQDESDSGVSVLLTGSADGLDALEAFTKMGSVELGILTRRISSEGIQVIHRRDEEVVGQELEQERR